MSVAVCKGDETFYTHTSTLLRDDDRSPEKDAVAKKVRHFAHLRDDGKKTSIILMTYLKYDFLPEIGNLRTIITGDLPER